MHTASERYLLYQPFRLLSTYFFSFSKTFFDRPGTGSSLSPFHHAVLRKYRIIGQERLTSKFCVLTRRGVALIAERLAHQDDLAFLEPLRRTHMHHQRTADARRGSWQSWHLPSAGAGRSRAETLRVLRRGDIARRSTALARSGHSLLMPHTNIHCFGPYSVPATRLQVPSILTGLAALAQRIRAREINIRRLVIFALRDPVPVHLRAVRERLREAHLLKGHRAAERHALSRARRRDVARCLIRRREVREREAARGERPRECIHVQQTALEEREQLRRRRDERGCTGSPPAPPDCGSPT